MLTLSVNPAVIRRRECIMTVYTPNSISKTECGSPAKTGQARRSDVRTAESGGFKTVLERHQQPGRNVHGKEKRSSKLEKSLQAAQTRAGRIVDTGFAVNTSSNKGMSSLETASTSALLRLNALGSSKAGTALALAAGGLSSDRAMAPLARMVALRAATLSPGMRRSCEGLGSLSARFESGEAGVDAIGYDRQGGTSYGQYQISSRAGTMSAFLEFLDERAPEWARGLRAAGPANTGDRGGAMPREWKRIAAENPDRFAALQRDFIERTHYLPALEEIREKTGVDMGSQPRALQEVLWSTAVQHGARGAARLFRRAIEQEGAPGGRPLLPASKVIDEIYSERAGQFGSSSVEVRAAVRKRFQEERKLALGMLNDQARGSRATV